MLKKLLLKIQYFNWANDYDSTRVKEMKYRAPEILALAINNSIKEPKLVPIIVDAAIGTGLLSQKLQRHFKSAVIHGLDFSGSMLKKAQEKKVATFLKKCDLQKEYWPVESGTADIVACSGALEHIDNLSHFFAEASRALKKGGILGLTHATSGYIRDSKEVRNYSKKYIQQLTKNAGFKVKSHAEHHGVRLIKSKKQIQYGFLVAEKT